MRLQQIWTNLSEAIRASATRRRGEDFACGDCLRNAQCGAAPDERCVTRVAQIATGRRRTAKRETIAGF